MNKRTRILIVTSVLAFCSMVYELILAQTLSAFLENTVLRYSVTIGLYMCSMGFGSLLAGEGVREKPVLNLLRVEVLLTVLGGLSVIFLFGVSFVAPARVVLSLAAHGLIVAIGVLTGFEIPLLIALMERDQPHSENLVLAWDYAGAFAGTLMFAFYFYPYFGLVASSLLLGCLNALCGLFLGLGIFRGHPETRSTSFQRHQAIQAGLCAVLVVCLFFSARISQFLINQYIQ
jgi:spermidine synthase